MADYLAEKGIVPVLAGTNLDRQAGDDVLAHANHADKIIDMIGKTSLMGLAGMLRHADLVIGNDTGPVFLAARLDAPTLMVCLGILTLQCQPHMVKKPAGSDVII